MAVNGEVLYNNRNKIDKVYNIYKNTISELIANIEVYEHDLPKDVMVQIAELFRAIASYENCKQENEENEWSSLCVTYSTVVNRLYCHAIFLFLKKIKEYEKLFSKYNYKGVMREKENFVIYAKKCKKKIKVSMRTELGKYYYEDLSEIQEILNFKEKMLYLDGYIKARIPSVLRKYRKEPYILVNNYMESDLGDVYKATKDLLKEYIKICPEVIKNGTKKTTIQYIGEVIVSWIIPFLLCANVIMNWFGIQPISYIKELFTVVNK